MICKLIEKWLGFSRHFNAERMLLKVRENAGIERRFHALRMVQLRIRQIIFHCIHFWGLILQLFIKEAGPTWVRISACQAVFTSSGVLPQTGPAGKPLYDRLWQITWHFLSLHVSVCKRCKPAFFQARLCETTQTWCYSSKRGLQVGGVTLPFYPLPLAVQNDSIWYKCWQWNGGGYLTPAASHLFSSHLSCCRACWASSSTTCQSLWLQCDFLWPIPLRWHGACSGTAAGEHFAGPAVPQWLCYPALQLEWTQSSSY